MTTTSHILIQTERLFDEYGFSSSSMDRLTAAAGVSTRTLYKHVGNKNALIETVLRERSGRFFARMMSTASVHELFVDLAQWTLDEGARGCFFLRAAAEHGHEANGVSETVTAYRRQLLALVDRVVEHDLGGRDELLTEQILVLFEGATSAATYRGVLAVHAAGTAAAALLDTQRSTVSKPANDQKVN